MVRQQMSRLAAELEGAFTALPSIVDAAAVATSPAWFSRMPLMRKAANIDEIRIEQVEADPLGHPDESFPIPDILRHRAQQRPGGMADGVLLQAESPVEPAPSQPDALRGRITRFEEELGERVEEDRLGLDSAKLEVEAKVTSAEPGSLERRNVLPTCRQVLGPPTRSRIVGGAMG